MRTEAMTMTVLPSTEIQKPNAFASWSGVFADLPAVEYYQRTIGVATKSGLDEFAITPAHYVAWCDQEDEDVETPAKAFGHAFHMRVLEPLRFVETYLVEPEWGYLKANKARGVSKEEGAANKARRDAWRRENKINDDGESELGRKLIGQAALDRVNSMAMRLEKHKYAGELLKNGMREVTFRWIDEATGLYCQCRVDFYTPDFGGIAIDLKSAEEAGPRAFARSCASYGYHRQDRMYKRGIEANKLPFGEFLFAAVEKTGRNEPALYRIDDEALADGEKSIERDLAGLAECLEKDVWPGYPENIIKLELPIWRDRA